MHYTKYILYLLILFILLYSYIFFVLYVKKLSFFLHKNLFSFYFSSFQEHKLGMSAAATAVRAVGSFLISAFVLVLVFLFDLIIAIVSVLVFAFDCVYDHNRNINELNRKINELEVENIELKTERNDLEDYTNALNGKIDDLKRKFTELMLERNEQEIYLFAEINVLTLERDVLNRKIDDLSEENIDLGEKNKNPWILCWMVQRRKWALSSCAFVLLFVYNCIVEKILFILPYSYIFCFIFKKIEYFCYIKL